MFLFSQKFIQLVDIYFKGHFNIFVIDVNNLALVVHSQVNKSWGYLFFLKPKVDKLVSFDLN